MDQVTVIIKLSHLLPPWRRMLGNGANLSREQLANRIAKGQLLEDPQFTALCDVLATESARLRAAADELDALRNALVPQINAARRYAGRVVMSATSLAKWHDAYPTPADLHPQLAHRGYTHDGENWSRPADFVVTGQAPVPDSVRAKLAQSITKT